MYNLGDIIQTSFVVSGTDGQIAVVTHTARVFNPVGVGVTEADVASMYNTQAAPLFKPLICGAELYYGCKSRKIWPLPPSVGASATSLSGLGTGGVNAMAKQTCGLITLFTALAGRRYRGRRYIPFPSTSDNSATGQPTAGYQTKLIALSAVFTTTYTVTNGASNLQLIPVIFHRNDHTTTDITGSRSNLKWATQRKRGDYGHQNTLPF